MALGLIVLGRQEIGRGAYHDALSTLRRAVELSPTLKIVPEAEVSAALVKQGRSYISQGVYTQALESLNWAIELSPTLKLKLVPQAEIAQAQGLVYARQGSVDQALATLREAARLDPNLTLSPETEIAQALMEQGGDYLSNGEFDKAVSMLKQASELDPDIAQDIQAMLTQLLYEQVDQYNREGEIAKSLRALDQMQALKLEPERLAEMGLDSLYNRVCWWGNLSNHADLGLQACERAVDLAPSHGGHLDSRGIARALTGDYAGAIQDFEFFVKWAVGTEFEHYIPQRQSWIIELGIGRNPFDATTLESLIGQ